MAEALRRIRDGGLTIDQARVEADAALRAYHFGVGNDPNAALYSNQPYSRYAGKENHHAD
jgi:hypothetical protein